MLSIIDYAYFVACSKYKTSKITSKYCNDWQVCMNSF